MKKSLWRGEDLHKFLALLESQGAKINWFNSVEVCILEDWKGNRGPIMFGAEYDSVQTNPRTLQKDKIFRVQFSPVFEEAMKAISEAVAADKGFKEPGELGRMLDNARIIN